MDEKVLKKVKRGVAYAMLGSLITMGAATHFDQPGRQHPQIRQPASEYSVLSEGPSRTMEGPGLDFTPAAPVDSPGQLSSSAPPASCQSDSQLEDVIASLKRSTVLIDTASGLGSGVVIAHRDGQTIILTNRHVVESEQGPDGGTPRAEEGITVHNDGMASTPVRVLVAPNGIDLALVVVRGDIGPDVRLANATIRRGTRVIAIGSPLGIEDSATGGMVSNFVERTTESGFRFTAIQTDAAINPGNSGGGLFLSSGELLGITTFKLRISPFETAEGMAFVIPINVLGQFPIQTWSELPMPATSHSGPDAGSASPGPSAR